MTMNGDMTVSAELERAGEQINMANLAENTRQSYRHWMRSFFDCVDKEPCEVTAEDVRG